MNKCVLCTFVKMVAIGLWHGVCPSIDKTKEEKKATFHKEDVIALAVGLPVAVLVAIAFMFIVKLIVAFLVWLFGKDIVGIILICLLAGLGITAVVVLVTGAIQTAKAVVACVKAYWRKAKEACE